MRVLPFVLALSLAPSFAGAQQALPAARPGGITFEALHPFIEDDDGVSILSGAYFLGVRYPLNERLAIVGELPFAYLSVDSDLGDESSSAIGNPLLGLALTRGDLEIGFAGRLPLAPDDEFAPFYGFLADPYRMEAFIPDVASLQATLDLQRMVSPAVLTAFELGAVGMFPTEGDGDGEVFLDYGTSAMYSATMARVGLRLNGRLLLSDDGSLADRSEHQAGLFADFGSGRFRPGIIARVPLDDSTRDELNGTIGITLKYLFQ